MSKARITYEIIAGVLSICTIGGTTAMCVPNSQTKIADYTAEKLSPKYAQIMELTKEQQEQIKNLEIEIDENGKVIINLQANLDKANQDNEKITNDLNIANGLIKDKDSEIASLQDDKTTLSNEINSLTEQKAQVQSLYEQGLITIEERDATISNLNSQINDKNTLIEQKTSQITILENEKQQLQTQVEELTNQKTQLEQDIATLQQEKATLQAEVAQLKKDKAELQNQVDTLNTQLAEFEQYTLVIDQTNSVESITIEDTKLGTTATMSNIDISTLKLYSWQNATIKYTAVENKTVKATLNGVIQETDTVTIVGSENKGANINVGSVTQPIGKVAGLYKTGTNELTKSWDQLIADGDITITTTDAGKSLQITNTSLAGDLFCGDVDGLTNLNSAFANCYALTSIDVTKLDTSNVTDMGQAFAASRFEKVILGGKFVIASGTKITYMFGEMSFLTDIKYSETIEEWTAKNITNETTGLNAGTIIHCADGDYTSI